MRPLTLTQLICLTMALPVQALHLGPKAAVGGELITMTNGTVAVTHSNVVTAASLSYSWNLPFRLTNGWWHFKLTLGDTQNRDPAIALAFIGSPGIRIYSGALPTNPLKPSEHEFWYYALSPITNLQILRNTTVAAAQASPLRKR